MANTKGKLKVFLCHASENKPIVKDLYDRLVSAGYAPWLTKSIAGTAARVYHGFAKTCQVWYHTPHAYL